MAKTKPESIATRPEQATPPGALDTPAGKGPIRIFEAGRTAAGDTRSTAAATRS